MARAMLVRLLKWFFCFFAVWFVVYLTGSIYSAISFSQNMLVNERRQMAQAHKHWINDASYLKALLSLKIDVQERLSATTFCENKFSVYAERFARLLDVVVDPDMGRGREGGEKIQSVLRQDEKLEYYKLQPGYFRLSCHQPFNKLNFRFVLGRRNHLNQYLTSLEFTDSSSSSNLIPVPYFSPFNTTVLVITRYEYANFYHTMTDFYNAYQNAVLLNLDFDKLHVMFADSHPAGSLDETWRVLFGGISRVGQLKHKIRFHDMVWVNMGYLSPIMLHRAPSLPLVNEFRLFFYSRFNIPKTLINRVYNCSSGARVLFLWRHDYLAHPRNPSGHVSRKIKNEMELLSTVKRTFDSSKISLVDAIQLDALPMKKQLELIAQTDVLIGMHGAGLTHALFLSKTSALIELYPRYWSVSNVHFLKIAQWRGLIYHRWVNRNSRFEYSGQRTYVPPEIVVTLLNKVLSTFKHKCPLNLVPK